MSHGAARRRMGRGLVALIAGLGLAVAVPVGSVSAHAQVRQAYGSIAVRLVPSSARSAGVRANGTVAGTCGSATITILPGPWSGMAVIVVRATSSWGPIVHASWSVRWQNGTSGVGGGTSGEQLLFSDVVTHADNVWTGRGWVTAWLASLEVTLWWGVRCRGLSPAAQAWIW